MMSQFIIYALIIRAPGFRSAPSDGATKDLVANVRSLAATTERSIGAQSRSPAPPRHPYP
ncbi:MULTISPECIES: hypothetical protein [unclassified Streptomyces]|uniref:hypothetical protein n=1 Tax=unclassified Streptomyces TaxID=2593676 RepID=UPI00168A760F|nr:MULTISPECIES: hypothetical protein [unclassified Streptomyces]MBD3005468.1 hypothetical protein [Streptomyces sp. 5-10]